MSRADKTHRHEALTIFAVEIAKWERQEHRRRSILLGERAMTGRAESRPISAIPAKRRSRSPPSRRFRKRLQLSSGKESHVTRTVQQVIEVYECKHITDLGNFHFSVVRWAERQRELYPERRDLVVACTIAISHVERKVGTLDASYSTLRRIVENWKGEAATSVMPRPIFRQLVHSYRADAKVSSYRWRGPLMWEFGRVGKFRKDMYASGHREPRLSELVLIYAMAIAK